jgi:oligopeptidase B
MTSDTNTATPRRFQSQESPSIGASHAQLPVARRHPVEHVIHNDRRIDNYAWLQEKQNPEVIAYLDTENAYTDAILHGTEAFQEKLYQEMLAKILQTDLSGRKKANNTRFIAEASKERAHPKNSCST